MYNVSYEPAVVDNLSADLGSRPLHFLRRWENRKIWGETWECFRQFLPSTWGTFFPSDETRSGWRCSDGSATPRVSSKYLDTMTVRSASNERRIELNILEWSKRESAVFAEPPPSCRNVWQGRWCCPCPVSASWDVPTIRRGERPRPRCWSPCPNDPKPKACSWARIGIDRVEAHRDSSSCFGRSSFLRSWKARWPRSGCPGGRRPWWPCRTLVSFQRPQLCVCCPTLLTRV